MSLRDHLRRLRGEGRPVARGTFTIDTRSAVEKLQRFRLADPHHYVLELLRAAVASGAREVKVRNDADDFVMRFSGRAFPEPVLSDLLPWALADETDSGVARHRLLALGVLGALQLDPRHLKVSESTYGGRLDRGGNWESTSGHGRRESRIFVRERLGWKVFREAVTGPRESRVLQGATRRCHVKLSVNGSSLRDPREEALASRDHHRGPIAIEALVRPDWGSRPSRVVLAQLGVRVVERWVRLPAVQVVAWANHDGLRRDASGADVVETDPALAELLAELARLTEQLIRDLWRMRRKLPHGAQARAALAWGAYHAGLGPAEPFHPPQWEGSRVLTGGEAPSSRARRTLERSPRLPGPHGIWLRPDDPYFSRREIRHPDRDGVLPAASVPSRRRASSPTRPTRTAPKRRRRSLGHSVARGRARSDRATVEVKLRERAEHSWLMIQGRGDPVEGPAPLLAPLRITARIRFRGRVGRNSPAYLLERERELQRLLVDAALDALARSLGRGHPSSALAAHARDMLIHLALQDRPIPDPLRQAPIFPVVGGGSISLQQAAPDIRYVGAWESDPTSEPAPVLVLDRSTVNALQRLLGTGRVRNVGSPGPAPPPSPAAEAEPTSPRSSGLALLRANLKLLQRQVSGALSPSELRNVEVVDSPRARLAAYDASTGTVRLNVAIAEIRGALETLDERPTALYVLLTAVYGAAARSLPRVSDHDQQWMMATLMDHLAASPSALSIEASNTKDA